jgi:hypothetical protein
MPKRFRDGTIKQNDPIDRIISVFNIVFYTMMVKCPLITTLPIHIGNYYKIANGPTTFYTVDPISDKMHKQKNPHLTILDMKAHIKVLRGLWVKERDSNAHKVAQLHDEIAKFRDHITTLRRIINPPVNDTPLGPNRDNS